MKEFELHPVDPGFKSGGDVEQSAADFAASVMDAMAQLMESAIERALKYVPVSRLLVVVDEASGNLMLTLDGRPVYFVEPHLLDVEVTVDGVWLDWPAVVNAGSTDRLEN